MNNRTELKIRLPADLKQWVAERAAQIGCSQNALAVLALRAAMEREQAGQGG